MGGFPWRHFPYQDAFKGNPPVSLVPPVSLLVGFPAQRYGTRPRGSFWSSLVRVAILAWRIPRKHRGIHPLRHSLISLLVMNHFGRVWWERLENTAPNLSTSFLASGTRLLESTLLIKLSISMREIATHLCHTVRLLKPANRSLRDRSNGSLRDHGHLGIHAHLRITFTDHLGITVIDIIDDGGGEGGGGWYDKHTRSTAADQPAPVPDYKVCGEGVGGGGGMISTPAQQLQTSLLLYRITK